MIPGDPRLVPSDLNLAADRRRRRERMLIAAVFLVLIALAVAFVANRP